LVSPSEIIHLKHVPVSINVLYKTSMKEWPDWCVSSPVDSAEAAATFGGSAIRPGQIDPADGKKWVLIPLPPFSESDTEELKSVMRRVRENPIIGKRTVTSIKYKMPFVELAYAVTFHKTQGLTLKKLIFDLNKETSGGFRLPHLYVALTRVRRQADYAVLPSKSGFRHLLNLSFSEDTRRWVLGLIPVIPSSKYMVWRPSFRSSAGTRKQLRRDAATGVTAGSELEPTSLPSSAKRVATGDLVPHHRRSSSRRQQRASVCRFITSSADGAPSHQAPSRPTTHAPSTGTLPLIGIANPNVFCYLISSLQVNVYLE
jgi:hypothetical protein